MNVTTLKHGKLRDEIDLPKIGALSTLTSYVEEWLKQVPGKEDYVFPQGKTNGYNFNKPLSRRRIYWIIYTQTGMFPHWLRAVCATIYGKVILKDAWDLKEFMGWSRLDSSGPYIQSNWKDKRKRINLL